MRREALFAGLAMLALAGCDRIPFLQGDPVEVAGGNQAGNSAATNASASAAPASAGVTSSRSLAGLGGEPGLSGGKDPGAIPAAASEGGVDPRLVGRWTDDGNCKAAVELRGDGAFVAPSGAMARWAVEGDQLVVTGDGGTVRLRIDSVGPDRIVTTNDAGETGPSTRC